MALTTYAETRPWARAILQQVTTGSMPPWHAAGEPGRWVGEARLAATEKELIRDWVRAGAPPGNPAPAQAPPPIPTGWRIGPPDLILTIPPTLVEGEEQTRTFLIETNLTQNVWVEAIEIQPGNPRLVHHASLRTLNTVFVPGEGPEQWPAGMAKLLPAGRPLELVIHYGRGQDGDRDATRIGLRFAQAPVRQQIHLLTLEQSSFAIPAHAPNHTLEAAARMPQAARVLSFNVEMRYRGKAARIHSGDLLLLDLPRYEYEWQRKYTLTQPVRLPAHSELRFTAIYDNSANYRSNPDPTKTIGPPEELMRAVMEYVLEP